MRAAGRTEYDAQIKSEIAQRMSKLSSLGIDTSVGKPAKPAGPKAVLPSWQQIKVPGQR
jgi:hypothetical protein